MFFEDVEQPSTFAALFIVVEFATGYYLSINFQVRVIGASWRGPGCGPQPWWDLEEI